MATLAKCEDCLVQWIWQRDTYMQTWDLRCPKCKGRLKRTSHTCKYPIIIVKANGEWVEATRDYSGKLHEGQVIDKIQGPQPRSE